MRIYLVWSGTYELRDVVLVTDNIYEAVSCAKKERECDEPQIDAWEDGECVKTIMVKK